MAKPTSVTNRIGQLRNEAGGVSQSDVATAVGVTRQTMNAIERGKYSPTLEVAFRIARFFDLQLDDVFGFDDTA